jgi:hypothetical protein
MLCRQIPRPLDNGAIMKGPSIDMGIRARLGGGPGMNLRRDIALSAAALLLPIGAMVETAEKSAMRGPSHKSATKPPGR